MYVFSRIKPIIIYLSLIVLYSGCELITGQKPDVKVYNESWAYEGISELKRGDIIVRANSNALPRASFVLNGYTAGHAAIVTKGSSGLIPDSLLANSLIFESTARRLSRQYQLRETKGFDVNSNPLLDNDSFSPRYTGSRYRLRLNIPEEQIEQIIEFIINQQGSYSSWNAMKRFPDNPEIEQMVETGIRNNWADNTHWYCSLIIWQAVLYITGIDLDANGGYFVYPNDLVASPYFDNSTEHTGRARF